MDWLRREGLLGHDRLVVEIGCGVGDRLRALSPQVEAVVGLDASGVMAAEARERTAGLGNVIVLQTSARDLSMIDDEAADLVLALDGLPDVESAGPAGAHIREAARMLRPGGDLVVLGWSRDGDDAQDQTASAEAAGLTLVTAGERPLPLLDGVLQRFRR